MSGGVSKISCFIFVRAYGEFFRRRAQEMTVLLTCCARLTSSIIVIIIIIRDRLDLLCSTSKVSAIERRDSNVLGYMDVHM